MFEQSPDYLGTVLGRDGNQPEVFYTIDQWTSRSACEDFKSGHKREFDAIDRRCESLTEEEALIAELEDVVSPPT